MAALVDDQPFDEHDIAQGVCPVKAENRGLNFDTQRLSGPQVTVHIGLGIIDGKPVHLVTDHFRRVFSGDHLSVRTVINTIGIEIFKFFTNIPDTIIIGIGKIFTVMGWCAIACRPCSIFSIIIWTTGVR